MALRMDSEAERTRSDGGTGGHWVCLIATHRRLHVYGYLSLDPSPVYASRRKGAGATSRMFGPTCLADARRWQAAVARRAGRACPMVVQID